MRNERNSRRTRKLHSTRDLLCKPWPMPTWTSIGTPCGPDARSHHPAAPNAKGAALLSVSGIAHAVTVPANWSTQLEDFKVSNLQGLQIVRPEIHVGVLCGCVSIVLRGEGHIAAV